MSQQKNFSIYHVGFFSMIFNVKTLPSSLLIHDFKYIIEFVTRVTRQVSLVDQELLTLPEHLSSTLVISGVCVARSLVSCVVFCRSLFYHCVVCPSSIYGFWLHLWYFQTFLYCGLHKNNSKRLKQGQRKAWRIPSPKNLILDL